MSEPPEISDVSLNPTDLSDRTEVGGVDRTTSATPTLEADASTTSQLQRWSLAESSAAPESSVVALVDGHGN